MSAHVKSVTIHYVVDISLNVDINISQACVV